MSNIHTWSSHMKVVSSFNGPWTNATQNGTGVNTQGYRRAAVLVDFFTGAATTGNFIIQDSPDNAVWTNVAGGTLATAIAANTADYVEVIDLDLAKRQQYVRVQLVGTGAAGNATADVILYEALNGGVTNTNAVSL